jgi:hypothetical protein
MLGTELSRRVANARLVSMMVCWVTPLLFGGSVTNIRKEVAGAIGNGVSGTMPTAFRSYRCALEL